MLRSGAFHWNREDPTAPFPDPDWERPLGDVDYPVAGTPTRFEEGQVYPVAPETSGGRFSQGPLDQPIFDMDANSPPTDAYGTPGPLVSGGCRGCKSGAVVTALPNIGPAILAVSVAAVGIGLFWWVTRK